MTRLCVTLRFADGGQRFQFRSTCLVLGVRSVSGLRGKTSLLGGFRQKPLLSIDVKDELAGRTHILSRAVIELFVAEGTNGPDRDAVHHVEVLTPSQELSLVHCRAVT